MVIFFIQLKKAIFWLSVVNFFCIFGCAAIRIEEGTFSPRDKNYIINIPETGKGWEPIRIDKEDVALWHKQYKAMIAIISSNIENKTLSPEMLSRYLFLGMADKKIISKEPVLVDDQSALHTILEGRMDNSTLKINSYVIKAGDKVYDLVCWAPSGSFDYIQGDFENMVRSFRYMKE